MTLRASTARQTLPGAVLLLFLFSSPIWSLDLVDGRVRLSLKEGVGRFAISCQTKGSNGIFVPLLAAQDPRTTMLTVVFGNRIFRMGESSEFSEKVERIAGGARFVWRSTFLEVTESFLFIASEGSSVSNGVRIELSLKNLTDKEITAGARYLFDTYLGESSFVHYRTPNLPQLAHELALTPTDGAPYWVSPLSGDADEFGLEVMTAGAGLTTPDRVVFANWKRLSDSSWAYETSTARNFSLLPYSVNDSAVAQYYDPRPIPRSGEATLTLALGLYTKAGFLAFPALPPVATRNLTAEAPQPLPQPQPLPPAVVNSPNIVNPTPDDRQAALADLGTVDTVLDKIDSAMSSASAGSEEGLAVIESALKELGGRSSRYLPDAGK